MSEPLLTVIVNTYRAGAQLYRALDALCGSRGVAPCPVLLMDASGASSLLLEGYWPITVVACPEATTSQVLNEAMRRVTTPWASILADDHQVHPDTVALLLHEALRSNRPDTWIMGQVVWPKTYVDPFQQYLLRPEGGQQSSYHAITNAEHVTWPHAYFAPGILSPAWWRDHDGFDESFPNHFADIEAGVRWLDGEGLTLRYLSEAVAYHDHLPTLRGFVARQRKAFHQYPTLAKKHDRFMPGLKNLSQIVLPSEEAQEEFLVEAERLNAKGVYAPALFGEVLLHGSVKGVQEAMEKEAT